MTVIEAIERLKRIRQWKPELDYCVRRQSMIVDNCVFDKETERSMELSTHADM